VAANNCGVACSGVEPNSYFWLCGSPKLGQAKCGREPNTPLILKAVEEYFSSKSYFYQ
jgi:hypothetical protein